MDLVDIRNGEGVLTALIQGGELRIWVVGQVGVGIFLMGCRVVGVVFYSGVLCVEYESSSFFSGA